MAKEDLKNNEELEESRSELRFEDIKKLDTSESNKAKIKEYFEFCSDEENFEEAGFRKMERCLEFIKRLDWKRHLKEKKINIGEVRRILNERHFGMESIKETILENLAIRFFMKNTNEKMPVILCLAGPAGTGKTSIAESIAEALGRKFEKISLSGVTTTFELTGLTKGYNSSAPGRIMKTLAKFGCDNPLILLDEVDKIMEKRTEGDIEGVLLEILDPDQNKRFRDEFLELEYDLSNVLFIATANDMSRVSEPLKSRMEIIYLDSYTLEEKVQIAKRYMVPSINKKIGSGLTFDDDVLRYIIENYTSESGVRKLNIILMKIYGKIAKNTLERKKTPEITLKNIDSFISTKKIPKIPINVATSGSQIGKVMGIALSPFGGRVIPIQTVIMPGRGEIIVTGNISQTMKEEIMVAITYLRTKSAKFHLKNPNFYREYDIHVHLSENSIQKDIISAGMAIATSILSALNQVKIRQDIAFTGELSILGEILPVGAVNLKIEEAYKFGIKKFFVPEGDKSSVSSVNKDILDKVEVEFVENYEQVYSKLFLMQEEIEEDINKMFLN